MAMSKGKRWAIAVGGVLLVLIVVAVGALQFAQREVKERVIAALGPLGSAESIDVGLTSVHLTNVLLKAPPGLARRRSATRRRNHHHARHPRSDRAAHAYSQRGGARLRHRRAAHAKTARSA